MQDDKEFYDNRLDLFTHGGWIDLLSELENLVAGIDTVMSVDCEKDLYYVKGQLSILNMLLNMEESTKLSLEQLDNEPEDY